MIETENQYLITQSWIAQFKQALNELEQHPDVSLDPRLIQGQKDGLQSMILELEDQIGEYEEREALP